MVFNFYVLVLLIKIKLQKAQAETESLDYYFVFILISYRKQITSFSTTQIIQEQQLFSSLELFTTQPSQKVPQDLTVNMDLGPQFPFH